LLPSGDGTTAEMFFNFKHCSGLQFVLVWAKMNVEKKVKRIISDFFLIKNVFIVIKESIQKEG